MTDERFDKLESRIAKLEAKPKSGWDIVQILGALLVPVAIAYAGNRFAAAQREAALEVERLQGEREYVVALTNARVGQAGVVGTLLDALVSPDQKRRKLAVEVVLIALPETGPALVRLVSESDVSAEVQRYSYDALARRRATLIADLFADTPARRGDAYAALSSGWGGDSTLVPELIAFAKENQTNANGVNNVLILLSHMKREALRPHVDAVTALTRETETIGARTKERSEILRSRLPQKR